MTDEAQVPPPPPPSDAPPPPPPPSEPPAAGGSIGSSDNRAIMIVLAYLGPLALIPFLVEKDDQEVQWHAKHGLVLFGVEFIACLIVGAIASATCLGCVIYLPVTVGIIVVQVMAIVKGLDGKRFIIPGLSEWADRF